MAPQGAIQKREGTTQPEAIKGGRFYRPYVDIIEKDNEYLVRADLPGTRADQIDVSYEQGLLTLHARVDQRQDPQKTNYLLREYGVGDFYRAFRIGEGIDAAGISAEYHDGVLTLHLPKAEEARPKKIQVKTA